LEWHDHWQYSRTSIYITSADEAGGHYIGGDGKIILAKDEKVNKNMYKMFMGHYIQKALTVKVMCGECYHIVYRLQWQFSSNGMCKNDINIANFDM
jgi:hypothetical protein